MPEVPRRSSLASKSNRNLRPGVSLPLLQLAKRAHVADDAAEIIPATNRLEAPRGASRERHTQPIKPGVDQRATVALADTVPLVLNRNADAAILQYLTIRGRPATNIGSPTPCRTARARSGTWSTIDANRSQLMSAGGSSSS